jgi:hypothetical protein
MEWQLLVLPDSIEYMHLAAGEDPSKTAWGTLVASGVNAQVGFSQRSASQRAMRSERICELSVARLFSTHC